MSKLQTTIYNAGTSITQQILNLHPKIKLEFEPHELWMVIQTYHISRYKNSKYHYEVLKRFCNHNLYYGAKFALNAGIEAMNWKWLEGKFYNPYYIFVVRNLKDTYKSWVKLDSISGVRGIVSEHMYEPWYYHINNSFLKFYRDNPGRATVINYDNMLDNPNKEFNPIFNMLQITPLNINYSNYIRKK